MRIKRFEAENMAAALAQVREEMGPDAVILNTKTVRNDRGVLGFLAKARVEVTAAIDIERGKPSPDAAEGRVGADESWRALQMSRAVIAPIEEELRELRRAIDRSHREREPEPNLSAEVAELRRLARAMAARVGEADADSAATGYRAAGLSPGISRELGSQAQRRILAGMSRDEALVEVLAERLEPRLGPPRIDVGHQLIVGPPGVGKTTALAKQAGCLPDANARIVSTDAQRLGGSDALRTIAKCLGMRFDVVASHDALARMAGKAHSRLLVDTAGGCRKDGRVLSDLALYRKALGARAEVQMVVSATTKECDLRQQLARYRYLEPHALVVTKVDESGDLGNIVNVLLDETTPRLAWLGSGQHIPDDFEAPNPHELARRVMEVSL